MYLIYKFISNFSNIRVINRDYNVSKLLSLLHHTHTLIIFHFKCVIVPIKSL